MLYSEVHHMVAWFPEGTLVFGQDWPQGWYYLNNNFHPEGPFSTERVALTELVDHMEKELNDPEVRKLITDEEARLGSECVQKIRAVITRSCCNSGCSCEE